MGISLRLASHPWKYFENVENKKKYEKKSEKRSRIQKRKRKCSMKINAKHFEKLSKLKRALCGPSVLELARFTGEPSIHQNDAPIYSWTSIKCQKFFSIFHFPFDFLFLFLLPRCGPLQTWCNQIESDTWDRGMVRLAAVSWSCMLPTMSTTSASMPRPFCVWQPMR